MGGGTGRRGATTYLGSAPPPPEGILMGGGAGEEPEGTVSARRVFSPFSPCSCIMVCMFIINYCYWPPRIRGKEPRVGEDMSREGGRADELPQHTWGAFPTAPPPEGILMG